MTNRLIIITGTPGVGKSTLAKKLVKALGRNWKRVDLHRYYKTVSSNYDSQRKCYKVNLKKLTALIKDLKKNHNLVFDSHISHLLPRKLVNLCIILTCPNLKLLKRRLQKRGYSKDKVKDNLQSEIFQTCLEEAEEKKHPLLIFDVTEVDFSSVVRICTEKIRRKSYSR